MITSRESSTSRVETYSSPGDNKANDESGNSGSSATIRNCDNNAINTLTQTNNSSNIAKANVDEYMNEAKESGDEEEDNTVQSIRGLQESRENDVLNVIKTYLLDEVELLLQKHRKGLQRFTDFAKFFPSNKTIADVSHMSYTPPDEPFTCMPPLSSTVPLPKISIPKFEGITENEGNFMTYYST
ncbi:hypothetical protein GQX74_005698 [Glossina fuscipes]|nr:hypothetical protein GQX74_005698 [Glossina fuscipes]